MQRGRVSLSLLFLFLFALSLPSFAQETEDSAFAVKSGPMQERSVLWRPMVSFLLPGFDQYAAGQWPYAAAYSGLWSIGLVWGYDRGQKLEEDKQERGFSQWSPQKKSDYLFHEELSKKQKLSQQMLLSSGGLSAWHAFRTSAHSYQQDGRYAFLPKKEEPEDLWLAPFEWRMLARPTTFGPLLFALGLSQLSLAFVPSEYQRDPLSSSDTLYLSAFSYQAGVWEEAFFRGYLQASLYETTASPLLANFSQAALFASAHSGLAGRPLVQFGMGTYLGWLHQHRGWSLRELIFIHSWWDVITLASAYRVRYRHDADLTLWLPALRWVF